MTLNEAFAKIIKTARKDADLTQEALSEKSGVSVDTISFIERGEYLPSMNTLYAFSKAFKIPANHLIQEVDKLKPKA